MLEAGSASSKQEQTGIGNEYKEPPIQERELSTNAGDPQEKASNNVLVSRAEVSHGGLFEKGFRREGATDDERAHDKP